MLSFTAVRSCWFLKFLILKGCQLYLQIVLASRKSFSKSIRISSSQYPQFKGSCHTDQPPSPFSAICQLLIAIKAWEGREEEVRAESQAATCPQGSSEHRDACGWLLTSTALLALLWHRALLHTCVWWKWWWWVSARYTWWWMMGQGG